MSCVLLAGQIASGKSSVATELARVRNALLVRVRQALAEALSMSGTDRKQLQIQGAELDRRTNGKWLSDYLAEKRESHAELVVDSIRTERQCRSILGTLGDAVLVYIEASAQVRKERFVLGAETDPLKRSLSFRDAMLHATERDVVRLKSLSELAINTDDLSVSQVVDEIQMGLERLIGKRET